LVAFQQGDFLKPVVLGGLWSFKHLPPSDNRDGLNARRMIRTPAGHAIVFGDGALDSRVEVLHADGQKITLGPGGKITIEGQSTELVSQGDLVLKAGSHELRVAASTGPAPTS